MFRKAIQSVWRDLGQFEGPDVQNETRAEREQRLQGPGPDSMEIQLVYPQLGNVSKEDHGDQESPIRKTIVRVPIP